ncbi:pelota family protein [Aquimarina algiphila]|uniref:hypothetical protein n=1 Tax=Aquimarina algiphila TaxID=2047982 RepID=UPI00232D26BE|nr:hypothetical protein [Aquimarina algiphila]
MKNLGIWIDKEKAHIISVKEESEDMTTIPSEIENYRIHGGSGTRLKGGPQDVVQDSKYLEREKHQFRAYVKTIVPLIQNADRIVIFGPAEARDRFNKELNDNYKDVAKKVKDVLIADSMTDNQTKALVRDYFNKFKSAF